MLDYGFPVGQRGTVSSPVEAGISGADGSGEGLANGDIATVNTAMNGNVHHNNNRDSGEGVSGGDFKSDATAAAKNFIQMLANSSGNDYVSATLGGANNVLNGRSEADAVDNSVAVGVIRHLHNLAPETFPRPSMTKLTTSTQSLPLGGSGRTIVDNVYARAGSSPVMSAVDYIFSASRDMLNLHDPRIPPILRDMYKMWLGENNRAACLQMSIVFNLYHKSLTRLTFYHDAVQLATGVASSTVPKLIPLDRGVRAVKITVDDVFNDIRYHAQNKSLASMAHDGSTYENPYVRLIRNMIIESIREYVGNGDSQLFKENVVYDTTDSTLLQQYTRANPIESKEKTIVTTATSTSDTTPEPLDTVATASTVPSASSHTVDNGAQAIAATPRNTSESSSWSLKPSSPITVTTQVTATTTNNVTQHDKEHDVRSIAVSFGRVASRTSPDEHDRGSESSHGDQNALHTTSTVLAATVETAVTTQEVDDEDRNDIDSLSIEERMSDTMTPSIEAQQRHQHPRRPRRVRSPLSPFSLSPLSPSMDSIVLSREYAHLFNDAVDEVPSFTRVRKRALEALDDDTDNNNNVNETNDIASLPAGTAAFDDGENGSKRIRFNDFDNWLLHGDDNADHYSPREENTFAGIHRHEDERERNIDPGTGDTDETRIAVITTANLDGTNLTDIQQQPDDDDECEYVPLTAATSEPTLQQQQQSMSPRSHRPRKKRSAIRKRRRERDSERRRYGGGDNSDGERSLDSVPVVSI